MMNMNHEEQMLNVHRQEPGKVQALAAGGTSPRSPAVSRGSCAASAAPACSLPRRQPSNGQSRAGAENRWAQRGAQRKGRSDESEAGRWLRTGRSPA